ncbi:hypothetical protein RchiOBHm_Chr6g0276451 [Rosa chinensis]|uniref:Uncharacterized protein n=1 Tax=Rosa chinensis TaxID=74649 RepID=A0A2P6PS98_ROSCH|nr:hypothetical protein RchiOBHm_Chr6g0276451 [Rosa chinensis]
MASTQTSSQSLSSKSDSDSIHFNSRTQYEEDEEDEEDEVIMNPLKSAPHLTFSALLRADDDDECLACFLFETRPF